MLFRAPLAALLLVALGAAPAAALGPGPVPASRIEYNNLLVARNNPQGLATLLTLNYRHRIFTSDNPALRDNYFGIGLAPSTAPSTSRLGAILEFAPASVFRSWVRMDVIGYYGAFGSVLGFENPRQAWSDDARRTRTTTLPSPEGEQQTTWATQLTFGANPQIAIGPIAARAFVNVFRVDVALADDDDKLYYDPTYDILIGDGGWGSTLDADLLALLPWGFTVGVRATGTHAFLEDSHGTRPFRLGKDANRWLNESGPNLRVGPLLAWTFYKSESGTAVFDQPTVLLLVQQHILHPYRAGQSSFEGIVPGPWSWAVPYAVLGFAFQGELTRRGL